MGEEHFLPQKQNEYQKSEKIFIIHFSIKHFNHYFVSILLKSFIYSFIHSFIYSYLLSSQGEYKVARCKEGLNMLSVLISLTICRLLQCKGKLQFIQHFSTFNKTFSFKIYFRIFFNTSQNIQQRLEEFLFCSSKQILVLLLKFPTLAILLICNDIYLNIIF